MSQSLNRSLWLDDRHILISEIFKNDMHSAQDIKVLIDREKNSTLPQDELTYSFIKLIQSDKMLAYIGIQDMERIVERMPAEKSAEFEKHLDKAINHFEKAEDLIRKGSHAPAVQHYNNAWNESFGFLIQNGAVLPPQVFIEEPADGSYTNSSDQRVSGAVFDLMVFFMTGVNITMDGITASVPLINGSFEHNVTLKENLNAIEVSAVNYFGNLGTAQTNVTLDTILPVITITGIAEGAYYARNVSASVEFVDLHPGTTEVLLDGKPYTSGGNISSEGRHDLTATAIDLAGNAAYKAINFTIDRTQPEIRILYPANETFVRQTVSIDGNASDLNLNSVTLSVDGVKLSDSSDFAWDTTTYSDGAHTITLDAVDKAGNSASTSVDVLVDNTLPAVTIKSPLNFYLRQGITIDADVTDANLESISVKMDGSEISTSLPYEMNTSLYPDGNHTIEIYGIDKAGNPGGRGVKVNFDNSAPEINITSPLNASFVKHAVEINGAVDDENLLAYMITVDGTAVSDSLPYLWDTFAYSDGNHTIRIDTADKAGNRASKEITVNVDNTLPGVQINFPPDGAFIRGVIDLTVDVFDANLDRFQIFINGVLVAENQTDFRWNTSEYPDGAYMIEVVAYDQAGNEMRKSVNVTVDNTLPMLIVNELTDNPTLEYPSYRINGTVEPDSIIVINGITITHSSSFEYAMNVTEGANVITVTATDRAGNSVSWTKTRLVDSDDLPDYYEIDVTGTDPLNGDSDSSKTPENEAGNGIKDDMEFFGSSELPAIVCWRIGSNPFVRDTDEDGLTDKFELMKLGLLTNISSPYTNGILDVSADPDNDNLTNLEEQSLGTDPLVPDTDRDNVLDKDEITAGTDPLVKDTDNDGLEDDSEFRLGTNPRNSDTDGDGIPDGADTYSNQMITGEVATLSIDGIGDLSKNTSIVNASGYTALMDMPGRIGKVVDISTTANFTSATVSIAYNESDLGGAPEDDLRMYYLNESDHSIVFFDVQGVDAASNVVWAETDHFTTIGVLSYSTYMSMWNSGSNPTIPEYTYGDKINLKAQVHNTGDAAVTDDVLVHFYEGNPDTNGEYIGSATITGGIAQGGAKTAVYYGYTLLSSSVDIYVKVDPLGSVLEKYETNNGAYKTLSIDAKIFDSDNDGLSDYDESNGMRTAFGIIRTNPNDNDSDDDNLLDGEEMGRRYNDYYYMVSNPRTEHSDNDGLNDFDEMDIGTNPLNEDTDGDNIPDNIDIDALVKNATELIIGQLEIRRDIIAGAVFGETGIDGGAMNWLVGEIAASPWYIVGWIAFSSIPKYGAIGDIRDALQAHFNGDEIGAAMNAAGAIPGKGDIQKMNHVIGLYITKYPGKISDIAMAIVKYLKYIPYESVKLGALDALYSGAATILKKGDINADDIFRVVENNGDLGKTLGVAKRSDGSIRWLEEGLTEAEAKYLNKKGPSGWKHIFEDHVKDYNNIDLNEFAKAFDPTGINYRNAESIQNLIYDSTKNGKIDSNTGRHYLKVTSTHAVESIVSSNGYIVTSHPIRIERVPIPI